MGPDPSARLPNGLFHFLVVVRFMFNQPVIQEIESGGNGLFTGAHVSYRITAPSLPEAASILEEYLASREPYDLMALHQAYAAAVEFEVCRPDSICEEYRKRGLVSESGIFYFFDNPADGGGTSIEGN